MRPSFPPLGINRCISDSEFRECVSVTHTYMRMCVCVCHIRNTVVLLRRAAVLDLASGAVTHIAIRLNLYLTSTPSWQLTCDRCSTAIDKYGSVFIIVVNLEQISVLLKQKC